MPLFPLPQPLNQKSCIATACRLYKQGWLRLLPLTAIAVLLTHFMRWGVPFLPTRWEAYQPKIAMFLGVFLFFMVFIFFTAFDQVGKAKPFSYRAAIGQVGWQFVSILGSVISMIFIPAIILVAGIGVYLYLGVKHAPILALYVWWIAVQLGVFATMLPKIFAPILVCIKNQEINNALANSSELIKGHYLATFAYALYAILVLMLLWVLPTIVQTNFPVLTQQISGFWFFVGGDVLLALIGPWSFALLLTQLYNLEAYQGGEQKEVKQQEMPSLNKTSSTDKNNITF